ncbi:putative hemoglobin and hemoglobin-haptoglobin-binding protein 2 precursor, partial [Haemophilus influenzae]
FNQRLQNLAC